MPPDGLRAADEVGADGRDRCFYVLSAIYAETGEDVQGVLPVCAGLLGLVQRVVCVGEAVVGAGLIARLVQFDGERECVAMVRECGVRVAGGVQ